MTLYFLLKNKPLFQDRWDTEYRYQIRRVSLVFTIKILYPPRALLEVVTFLSSCKELCGGWSHRFEDHQHHHHHHQAHYIIVIILMLWLIFPFSPIVHMLFPVDGMNSLCLCLHACYLFCIYDLGNCTQCYLAMNMVHAYTNQDLFMYVAK